MIALAGAASSIGAFLAASSTTAAVTTAATVAGGALAAKSLFSGSPKAPTAQSAGAGVGAVDPNASLAKAKEDATKRLKMIAASGGQSVYAGSASVDPGSIKLKTLLG